MNDEIRKRLHLFRSELDSGGDLDWNFTGFGLEDSGVDLSDLGEEAHSVVFAKSLGHS